MSYKVVTDRIEVRSLEENNKPRYIVNGTAQIANKKQIYQFIKNKDGSVKTLKNIFTPHCLESIRKQSKHKKLFVDTQHELGRNASIKALAKDKLTEQENNQLDNMLKRKMLPLSKINDVDIKGDVLDIYTELNPMFREVDEDHKNYFDAVWHSLENKFLNSISINFGEFKYDTNIDGDMVIDDVDILGFSYEDGASGGADHSIYEVAMRALEEGINIREGEEKMKEEKEKLEKEKAELEVEKKKIAEEKAKIEADKKTTEEEAKAAEIKKQEEEQAKAQKELEEKAEKAKQLEEENVKLKGELDSVKGVVRQRTPPASGTPAGGAVPPKDEKFYKENLKEITKEHDETMKIKQDGKEPLIDNSMKGFGEMVNLQAQANNPTADLDDKNAEFINERRLLDKVPTDVVTPRTPRAQQE